MSQLSYWKVLTRRKTLSSTSESETKLNRVLGTFDLTALGVGATLGVGVYVLAGHVARDQAGPSVILSFAIAALASLFAGLCYAEFGARVPRAGSAYIYSYVCIGELAAFVVGWNLILEYIIGSASVSKGLSLYLDTLINGTFKTSFRQVAPINWEFTGSYFDFFAFCAAFMLGIALAFGLQKSTIINNCFTVLNVGIVLFVIVAGSIKADVKYWQVDPTTLDTSYNVGAGGFFPFGFEGTLKGAATCFFGFVGFDCIATTGEEVKNPRRAIPRAILFSLLIIFLAYFGVSTVLTLMLPYYLQNVDAPLPYAFDQIGWPVAKWIVTIGGMFGLVASLFGAMFPLPRIIYAMSQDGLIFRFLGEISPKFKTPVAGTLCAAVLTGLMAAIFDLTQLVNMLSIGTLLAYTVVAISITILRFMDNNVGDTVPPSEAIETTNLTRNTNKVTGSQLLLQVFNCRRVKLANKASTRVVGILLLVYCLCCFGISLTVMHATQEITNFEPWAVSLIGCLLILILLILLAISVQPRENSCSAFTVPLVPLIPGISIFVNIYLMLQLDIYTWIRFGIWMAIGSIIYLACICLYGTTEVRNESILQSRKTFTNQNGTITKENLEAFPAKNNGDIGNSITVVEVRNEEMEENFIRPRTPSPKQSLDEIILASELDESVIEMKNSNGKTIFVEDNTSQRQDTEVPPEDEKTALAILDDVLQVEELTHFHDFSNRKISVDSEHIPSFIESSTIAMIHSSCNDLTEENENELEENFPRENSAGKEYEDNKKVKVSALEITLESEKSTALGSILKDDRVAQKEDKSETETPETKDVEKRTSSFTDDISEKNVQKDPVMVSFNTAVHLVSDILTQPKVEEASRTHQKAEEDVQDTNRQAQKPDENPQDTNSSSSRKTSSSDGPEDNIGVKSLQSERFRDKLSRLIMVPSPQFVKPKKIDEVETPQPIESPSLHQIRPSKSESDLRAMLNLEIRKTPNSSEDIELKSPMTPETPSNIPKAPKFDPILYKTLGNRRHQQERPKLPEFSSPPPVIASEIASPTPLSPDPISPDVPFREKLNALLQRGPSYRISGTLPEPMVKKVLPSQNPPQTQPIPNGHMPSENNHHQQKDVSEQKANFPNVLDAIKLDSQPNNKPVIQRQQRPKTIEEALRSLRSVPTPIE